MNASIVESVDAARRARGTLTYPCTTDESTPVLCALVVDDHLPTRALLALTLEQAGFASVEEAADGREAVDAVNQHFYDLVVMDDDMPNMGGVDATMTVVRRRPSVRVVGFSGHDAAEVCERFFQAGASMCFRKDELAGLEAYAQELSRRLGDDQRSRAREA